VGVTLDKQRCREMLLLRRHEAWNGCRVGLSLRFLHRLNRTAYFQVQRRMAMARMAWMGSCLANAHVVLLCCNVEYIVATMAAKKASVPPAPEVKEFITTPLTKLFHIKHPILLAGMNVAAGPELAAAVTNAGLY
jgi:hypothetical protein